jgi:hypothetical protein
MGFLAYFQEDHGRTAVLTKRQVFPFGNTCILYNLVEDLFTQRGFFILLCLLERVQYVLVKLKILLLIESGDRFRDVMDFNFP